jgi:putative tricarboxylic transport membrane protein
VIERLVNICWILIGAAAASIAWNMNLTGPYGPDSGLFPFIAALMVSLGGLGLMLNARHRAQSIDWPDRLGSMRVVGVVVGVAVMTFALPRIGFAAAGVITMLILLRAVERTGWRQALGLSVASVAVVIGLFDKLLGMPLPRGPWGF